MVDDKPDDIGAQADLDAQADLGPRPDPEPPKRAPPTLDLDAIEISDETRHAAANAGNAKEKPSRAKSPLLPAMISSAVVSALCGAGAAALVIWASGWPGEPAAVSPPQISSTAIDALAARVASVESKAPAVSTPDPALSSQVDALQKSGAALRDELAATRAQTEKLAAAVNDVRSAPRAMPPPDLSAINERLAKLEAAARTLSVEAAQRDAAPAHDTQLRQVVAASLLDVSVRTGEPYAAALSAAKPFAANADMLKPLDAFAATGVPSVNGLDRELLALLPKLSPAPENSTAGSGIVDRLQAGAARLVRIERTDAVVGDDRNAVVARVTAAALRNDIVEARRELRTLAPADRAAAQAWIDKADARDAALAASRQFAADAMGAFTKPAR